VACAPDPRRLAAIWVRDRLSGDSAEVVHCHMLFHLAHPFIRGRGRVQVERGLERLIDRHGEANYLDCTLKLTFPTKSQWGLPTEGRRTRGVAKVRSAELLAQGTGHHSRQALRGDGEPWRGCTKAMRGVKRGQQARSCLTHQSRGGATSTLEPLG
jgi:hypothetical protein